MRRLTLLAALVVAVLAGVAGSASAAPPAVDARSWLVENAATGELLASSSARQQLPIASITKLMTVLVTLDHHRLTDVVTVDPRAAAVGQESIYLRSGESLSVAELVKAALIQSANNAAAALALSVAPNFETFAALMNAKARELGLRDSNFVRPDGLDAPNQYSSARDATSLAEAAMRVPFIRRTVRQETATIGGDRTLHTWNDLLGRFPGLIGVKTGHTNGAGWSQVAAVRSDAGAIYATILGSPSRAQRNSDLQRLLVWGIAQYRTVEAISGHRIYAEAELPYGRGPLALVAEQPLRLVVRPGRPLVERVIAPTSVSLPVERGQVVGRVEIWGRGRLLGTRPLVAAASVTSPSTPGRIGWYAKRTVHHVLGVFP